MTFIILMYYYVCKAERLAWFNKRYTYLHTYLLTYLPTYDIGNVAGRLQMS